jgi:sulfate permease, SulP family
MSSTTLTDAIPRRSAAPSIGAGLLIGVVELVFTVSVAVLLYREVDASYLASGIGLILLGAIPGLVLIPLLGSYKGHIALVQDAPAVIMALVTTAIGSSFAVGAPRAQFVTVAAAIGLTTLGTGLLFLLVGQFKLGSLVRFLPYPVIGGFLAGTGWLLTVGGIEFMADTPVGIATLGTLFQPEVLVRWVPGLLAGALMLWLITRFDNYILLPGLLGVLMLVFYGVMLLNQTPLESLREQGWLLGAMTSGKLLPDLSFADVNLVDWRLIGENALSLASIALISLTAFLLNIGGIELAVGQDIDFDHELRVSGFANTIAGLLGGAVIYPAISTTTVNHKMSGAGRWAPFVAALIFVLPFVTGVAYLAYIPKLLIGALLVVFGLTFLYEWIYSAWWKFSKLEYAIVLLILASIATLGFLPGVGVGFIAAVALFVVDYSRVNVARHALTGAEVRSRRARTPDQRAQLIAQGHQTQVMKLQGYLFFGTAHTLLENVRKRVDDATHIAPRFLLLDFEKVSGVDASALLSLAKMKQVLAARAVALLIAGPSAQIRTQLIRAGFEGPGPDDAGCFPDLDRGLEWVENQLLHGPLSRLAQQQSLRENMAQLGFDDAHLSALITFLEKRSVGAGDYLIRQGDTSDGVYFLESGQVTAQLELLGKPAVRLESMGPGHVLGELGYYLGQQRSAAVIADEPCTVHFLSAANLTRMEQSAPELAARFHRAIVQLLAARTSHLVRVVEALER